MLFLSFHPSYNPTMALIVIDPGHGGHNLGAVGSSSKEKGNVLRLLNA